MVIANVLSHTYMIEPNKDNVMVDPIKTRSDKFSLNSEDEDVKRPDTIDQKTMWNIVGGALLDNIGSTGLFPLCLSPLALEAYYGQFIARNEEPIMSILGCKSYIQYLRGFNEPTFTLPFLYFASLSTLTMMIISQWISYYLQTGTYRSMAFCLRRTSSYSIYSNDSLVL